MWPYRARFRIGWRFCDNTIPLVSGPLWTSRDLKFLDLVCRLDQHLQRVILNSNSASGPRPQTNDPFARVRALDGRHLKGWCHHRARQLGHEWGQTDKAKGYKICSNYTERFPGYPVAPRGCRRIPQCARHISYLHLRGPQIRPWTNHPPGEQRDCEEFFECR